MEKDFLKLTEDPKKLSRVLLISGILLTIGLGIRAFGETGLEEGALLPKKEPGEGTYEQELIAYVEEQKIPLTITVEEVCLSEEDALEVLETAKKELDRLVLGENESFTKISTAICFADQIPDTPVEVTWIEKASDFFCSDGRLREELTVAEPLECMISAILTCQEVSVDYEVKLIILPREMSLKNSLEKQIRENGENEREAKVLSLPTVWNGSEISWRKPIDLTFFYVLLLTAAAAVFLRVGAKRDAHEEKKKRQEAYEREYAQLVSKFTMLLSAGISVRNAWERIVQLYLKKSGEESPIMEEMNWAYRELQKGRSELEVYELFGTRVGVVSYKKLMALFISDKKRGSIRILDAMNQEMLEAWDDQKRSAKQQGEKLGTKLLVPMMGMLVVVFLMILIPAFLSFQL